MQTAQVVTTPEASDHLADIMHRGEMDLRMVSALAGDRNLNAREQAILERLKDERGDGIFTDLLYTLTHHIFPARQARDLWHDIATHRSKLSDQLGRDPGLTIAAHDYLTNVSGLLKQLAMMDEHKLASLANVATHDGLTGLFDHATFKHRLKEELERVARYGGTLSLAMLDIDHFKKINDTHGHAEGDAVLKQLADLLRSQVRSMDTVARYGGEEFAIILPEVNEDAAFLFAERLRTAMQAGFSGSSYPVTASIGIASNAGTGGATGLEPSEVGELVKRADKQLYRAKKSGRNRTCRESDPNPEPSQDTPTRPRTPRQETLL